MCVAGAVSKHPRMASPHHHQLSAKLQTFIASSREIIVRVPRSSLVDGTSALLDEIEVLIDHARADLERLGPLVKESLARMNIIATQLEHFRKVAS